MSRWLQPVRGVVAALLYAALFVVVFLIGTVAEAANILDYKDTISNSAPGQGANHTLEFTITTDLSPGSVFEITPPAGFTTPSPTTTFAERNVELYVNGTPRSASASGGPTTDAVTITGGTPGQITYTLHPGSGISAGSLVELRIGNHTSNAEFDRFTVSTSTGTTTIPDDAEPILNSSDVGTHRVQLEIFDGATLVADAGFLIAVVNQVGVGPVDTTEEIPPFRFEGAPTGTVAGTSLFVEISLETDEFADCRYSNASGTPFASMGNVFDNTGLIFHTTVVPVTPNEQQNFYIRCIDDEGNFNIDDYLLTFFVNAIPTGQANEEGEVEGDGTGTGDSGTGDGGGSGGETGEADGESPLTGGTQGTGGGGGGSRGGTGDDDDNEAGGGFESSDGPYRSGDGRVVISGYAYPNAEVTFNVDGTRVDTVRADNDGQYEVTLDEIARGAYTFGIFATGPNDVDSSVVSTSFTVTGARTSALSNINIPPSILVEPDPVDPGTDVTISGYALPDSTITIENQLVSSAASRFTETTTSDSDGRWSIVLDTSGFSQGTYQVRARAVQSGTVASNYSDPTFYGVGQEADVPINADLNRDGSVNLIDFSILLFWWESNGGDSDPPADINRDGVVNLTDFSILLFNWTG